MAKINLKCAFLILSFYAFFLLFSLNFFGLLKSNVSGRKFDIIDDINEEYHISKLLFNKKTLIL
jgi:hypothetical protein